MNTPTNNSPMNNSGTPQDQRASARAHLAAERQRQERLAARRRIALVALATVLVVGGGVGASIALAGGPAKPGTTAGASTGSAGSTTAVPANTTGPGGTVIVYGKADAPNTLDVYEDFRCPICDKLERADGSTIQKLADDGTYRIQFHMATFLDDNLGGTGSLTALAAAGAALNESPAKFQQFRAVLFANQPDEQNDAFAGTDHLLELAGKVPGLRTPAFDQAVRNGTYKAWAAEVGQVFSSSGVTGTPTLKLNGTVLDVFDNSTGSAITPAQFEALVRSTAGAKK